MTQRLEVKNFGAIREAKLEIQPLTVFIGPHASGKSTLAKLIHFFRNVKDEYFKILLPSLKTKSEERIDYPALLVKKMQQAFYANFGSTRHIPDFEITFSYNGEGDKVKLSKTEKGNLFIKFEPAFYGKLWHTIPSAEATPKVSSSPYGSMESHAEQLAYQEKVARLKQDVQSLFHYPKEQGLFIPAGRNITVSFSEQFQRDYFADLENSQANEDAVDSNDANATVRPQSTELQNMESFMRAVEHIKAIFAKYSFLDFVAEEDKMQKELLTKANAHIEKLLRGKYKQDQHGEKILIAPETYVLLNRASSGQQEVIRIVQDLFLLLQGKIQAFRTIEEPEAHLYPQAQKELMELIAFVIQHSKTDFVLTTHSPYVLSIINVLLMGGKLKKMEEEGVEDVVFSLSKEDVAVYNIYLTPEWHIKDGIDKEAEVIGENNLDEISYALGDEFSFYLDRYRKAKKKGGKA